jgi:hypothetical protein
MAVRGSHAALLVGFGEVSDGVMAPVSALSFEVDSMKKSRLLLWVMMAAFPGIDAPVEAQKLGELCRLTESIYRAVLPGKGVDLPEGYVLLEQIVGAGGKSVRAMAAEHKASGRVVIVFRGSATTSDRLAALGPPTQDIVNAVRDIAGNIIYQAKESAKAIWEKVTKRKRKKKATAEGSWPREVSDGAGVSGFSKLFGKLARSLKANKPLERKLRIADTFIRRVLESLRKSDGSAIQKSDVILFGHSYGGYVAQIAGARYGLLAHALNSPGPHDARNPGPFPLIVNHVRMHDVFGRFGHHYGKVLAYPDERFEMSKINQRWFLRNHSNEPFCPLLDKYWPQDIPRPAH